MTRDESVGLGAIHADDELLDRLARRDDASFDGLESMLASWTAQIDADAEEMADRSGPWGLRGHTASAAAAAVASVGSFAGQAARRAAPRTIRIPVSRAAAVAGALALTMSGGGVAAALTGQDVPIVSRIVKALPGAPAGSLSTDSQAADVVTLAVEDRIRAGHPEQAREIVDVLSNGLGTDAGPVAAAQIEALDRRVDQAELVAGADPAATTTMTPAPGAPSGPPIIALPATSSAVGIPSSTASALVTIATTVPFAPQPESTEPEGQPTSPATTDASASPAEPTREPGSSPSGSNGSSGSTGSSGSSGSGSSSSPTLTPSATGTATASGVLPTDAATPSPSQTPTSSSAGSSSTSSPSSSSSSSTSHSSTSHSSTGTSAAGGTSSGTSASESSSSATLTRGGTSSDRAVATSLASTQSAATTRALTNGATVTTTDD